MKEQQFKQLKIACCEFDKVWAYCVYHKDINRPNMSISLLDRYYGKYTCWACGEHGHLSSIQMQRLNLSDLGVYKNNKKDLSTRWQNFSKDCYENLRKFPLLKLGLLKQLNVSTESLDAWRIGYDGVSFIIPMLREDLGGYYYQNGFCGAQRRFSDGTKRCIKGSCLGLMYSYEDVKDSTVFICEGFSDGISVYDLGLNSIARPHCHYTGGISDFLEEILFTWKVVIIPDNDVVGIEGAEKLYKILEQDSSCCAIFDFDGAKDIRSYIAKVGKERVRRELRYYS